MSGYKTILPNIFPFCVAATPNHVHELVTELLDPSRTDVPQGSSFAITVDNWDGTWNLWLSMVSLKYLEALHPDLKELVQS